MADSGRPLLFHIIYTAGTVRPLLPFVDTLLRWSDCAYCLVANGCGKEEVGLLDERCAVESRLSWRSLPFGRKVEHGQALNYLCTTSNHPYFCFMDSDILATGNFMADLWPVLPSAAGLFSAWPVTIKAEERILPADYPFIGGRHSITADGLCLGGSYFAIYERSALSHALAKAPDGFNRGYWRQLPIRTRQFLRKIGQERLFYDTGRVLNLYLLGMGGELRVQDCASLLHLGSFSIYTGGSDIRQTRPRWLQMARAAGRRVHHRINGQAYRTAILDCVAQDPIQRSVDQRRESLAGYFATLSGLPAKCDTGPSNPTFHNAEIDENVKRATKVLLGLQIDRQATEKPS